MTVDRVRGGGTTGDHGEPWGTMGDHGGPWGTMGDRGNQLEPAGTLESQPGVLDDGMQNSALGCMISRLYQCFSFVAREFSPRNDQTPCYTRPPQLSTTMRTCVFLTCASCAGAW